MFYKTLLYSNFDEFQEIVLQLYELQVINTGHLMYTDFYLSSLEKITFFILRCFHRMGQIMNKEKYKG